MNHAESPHPRRFRVTVHGTVFGGRERWLERLTDGAKLRLVADPTGQAAPDVWVHLLSGEPVGHLPPDVGAWLWAWLARGGRADATAVHVGPPDKPSRRRLVVEVVCDD